jgi:hypothetical protein
MSTENKQRDKLDYIQFDHDFLSKHKTQALHLKFGNDGLLAIMGAIFLMGNATDGEIEIDAFIANARIYGCDADKCNDVLNYCLHPDRKLFLSGSKSGWITNSRVTEDQERVYLKREKWRASQKKRRCPDSVSLDVMQDTHETSHETLNTEHMNTEDLNSEDLNSNPKQGGSKGGNPPEAPKPYANALPESLDTPEIRDALGIWLVKQVQLHKPRDQMAIEALTANWANRPKEFLHALRESTANGWKTLIEPKSTAGPPNGRISYEKETNYDRNVRNILEA